MVFPAPEHSAPPHLMLYCRSSWPPATSSQLPPPSDRNSSSVQSYFSIPFVFGGQRRRRLRPPKPLLRSRIEKLSRPTQPFGSIQLFPYYNTSAFIVKYGFLFPNPLWDGK